MPADDRYVVVDSKAKPVSPYYGCYNKELPKEGDPVPGVNGTVYPYRFSTECRYDKSLEDNRCKGCKHSQEFKDWHVKGENK